MFRLLKTVLVLYLICLPEFVYSQIKIQNDLMGMAYVSMGYQNVSFTEFDEALSNSSLDYPLAPTTMYTFGAGGVFVIKDWILAGEGSGFLSSSENFGEYNSRLGGGFVTLDTGFLLKRTKKFLAYPLIGIGGSSISYKIYQEPTTQSFAEALENPQSEITLNNKSIFFHLALAMQYHLNFMTDEEAGNFFIGFRGGYKTTLKTYGWYIQGTSTKLAEGPITDLDGYYIQIMLGISGENFLIID